VAAELARLKEMAPEELGRITSKNFQELFLRAPADE
jgi:Tat protein secretion system quality control protein TatD with DNase activity